MTALNLPDAADLLSEDIAPAIAQLAGLQTALAARLITERQRPETEGDDKLLSVRQAAEILSVSAKWIYANAKKLPFTRRPCRGKLCFSKNGLYSWISKRR